ncbi:BTAD domain-containing putative transcriptional regulator [Streptomyces sp. NPDC006475]|uniref:BTAD domain-containing putative transcriptional regulator n=1 Tax=Streptomyces sp. NPDC006475 TaxID=3155719 RepID=UPI0033A2203F
MEIHILGPLEVMADGRLRPLPPRAEQSLLVRLLLNAGRVVTAETLVDALWGADLPTDPGNALQGRVSKLRRALAAQGLPATLIATRPPGYVAQIKPEQVDAQHFTRLVAEARHLAAPAPADAIRRYQEALALWRGPALAGFTDEDWARTEAARLEEARVAAVEEQFELLLAAGRHADVIGDLEALVGQYPLRERLHGQLMLALYRSGRQAEALAVFQRAREILGTELGLDPSADLRQLEEAILRQDPALGSPAPQQRTAPVSLPPRLTSFVGRAQELKQILTMFANRRLVTLTGPGGVGKTSLAAEAARFQNTCPDGTWLVRLSGVTEPHRVPRTVADALGIPLTEAVGEDHLVQYLHGRAALLVLDNCEHLADACAALAERLLTLCPSLRVLATSREPLNIPGEAQYAVAPLSVPPGRASSADLVDHDAVRLFFDRARSALSHFELDEESSSAVAQICRSLDGIPLAIELAAVRVKTLPVQEIASRLDDLGFLSTTSRTAEARQQTLRATVDWSHELLTGPERILFRRLSVFRGGCSLQAAQAVCAGNGLEPGQILDVLGHLVDRSLVVAGHAGQARFRLLETLRQYGRERLREAGEEEWISDSHAQYFTNAAEMAESQLRGPHQGHWLRWLREERDNIRAALRWCHAHARSHPDRGLRLAAALGWFWYFASYSGGGREIQEMLAVADGGSASARARALQAQALAGRPGACVVHPDRACAAAAQESLRLLWQTGHAHRAAYSQTFLAVEGISGAGTHACLMMLAEAAEEFTRQGDEWGRALTLFVEMELRFALGTFDSAADYGTRALSVFRTLGDHWGISAIQYHLGLALHRAGRLPEAAKVYEGALAEGRKAGLANTVQYALANLGHVALALGDLPRAERRFEQSHAVARELGADGNPMAALGQAHLARQRDDPAASAHYTRVLELLHGQDKPDWAAGALTGLGFLAELAGDLDTAQSYHRRAWRTAAHSAAVGAVAGAMEGLACTLAASGDGEAAARLLGAAARWRDNRGCPASPAEWQDIERATTRCRALLGDDLYRAAYTAGSVSGETDRSGAEPPPSGSRTDPAY